MALLSLNGKKATLTERWNRVGGLGWSPDGQEVWFTATDTGANQSLYAVTRSGKVRVILRVPGDVQLKDVSKNGRVLLALGDPRVSTLGMLPGDTRKRDLSWLDYSFVADIAADGQTLLFDEEGEGGGANYTVYLRKADGSPVVRLGEGAALAPSPDGGWALAGLSSPESHFMLLPSGTGDLRPLPTAGTMPGQSAAWMPDGEERVVRRERVRSRGAAFSSGRGGRKAPRRLAGRDPDSVSGLRDLAGRQAGRGDRSGRERDAVSDRGRGRPGDPGDRARRVSAAILGRRKVPLRLEAGRAGPGSPPGARNRAPRAVEGADARGSRGRRAHLERRRHADGRYYAYTVARQLWDLFVVEGLK